MTLLTAHKILISAALALGAFYALWELSRHGTGDAGALLRAAASGATTVALGFYLRWVWMARPTQRAKERRDQE